MEYYEEIDIEPPGARFWLEYQVSSDGLESEKAQRMTAIPSFPRFVNLPLELRLKVWEYLIQPRIVIVSCFERDALAEHQEQLSQRPRCPHVPVLLHINHETRTLALKHYERAFAWKTPHVLATATLETSSSFSAHSSNGNGNGTGNGIITDGGISSPSSPPQPPLGCAEPRVWFNFDLDALFLMGELEPYDSYGFNSPLVYFLRKEDTKRVRHVAVAFEGLHYGEYGSEQIFGTLFHIVDRFSPAGNRVLVTTTPADEVTNHLMGGRRPLVWSSSPVDSRAAGGDAMDWFDAIGGENVAQRIWKESISGTAIARSALANTRFLMIHEVDLEAHLRERS